MPVIVTDISPRKDLPNVEVEAEKSKRIKRSHDPQEESHAKRAKKDPGKTPKLARTYLIHNGPYKLNENSVLPDVVVKPSENIPQVLHQAFAIHTPCFQEMTKQISNETYCPQEREWLDKLPADSLFMQAARFSEMVSLQSLVLSFFFIKCLYFIVVILFLFRPG